MSWWNATIVLHLVGGGEPYVIFQQITLEKNLTTRKQNLACLTCAGTQTSEISKVRNSISYDFLDHSRAFLFSVRKKNKQKKREKKSEAKNLCVEVGGGRGGGGGGGALQLKKDDNRFLFSGFRVFRI